MLLNKNMDVSEAIRFLGLNFLETCQEYLDESTYSSAKVLIEQTKKEKLLKKVLKFMKPFEPLINKETITKIKDRNDKYNAHGWRSR